MDLSEMCPLVFCKYQFVSRKWCMHNISIYNVYVFWPPGVSNPQISTITHGLQAPTHIQYCIDSLSFFFFFLQSWWQEESRRPSMWGLWDNIDVSEMIMMAIIILQLHLTRVLWDSTVSGLQLLAGQNTDVTVTCIISEMIESEPFVNLDHQ